MIASPAIESASPGHLVTFLTNRRQTLLTNWRISCTHEFALLGAASLSDQEFTSNVPFMLNTLQQHLEGQFQDAQIAQLAAEHGLHRWQKGYSLAELTAEMQCLGRLLLAELRAYWQDYPTTDCPMMSSVYEYFATFSHQISTASVTQYADLQRNMAFSRVEALEKALAELTEMGKQRAELLRHSSHDLRGSFGAIQGAASLLEVVMDSQEERQQMLAMLQRNLTNCRSLVTQLMDLARLEAGQESIHIQAVDAAHLLTSLVASYQPLAIERGLLLKADGPPSLLVDTDPLHLQRIIQNLVLNALKHTPTGFVSVCWNQQTDDRWLVSVQDSGPGLPTTNQGSFAQGLALESIASVDLVHSLLADVQPAANTQAARLAFSQQGEGIGLSIVKGLCELLQAKLEIDSTPGEGTLFRIQLAIHWQP